jgi:hypothetical protein
METDQVSQVESIFLKAIELESTTDRQAYLDTACDDDSDLRNRVERLLGAHPKLGDFLQNEAPGITPNAATIEMPPLTETVGSIIGPYKLMKQIGEGGMGVVYVAQQEEPVKRKVALKIIKPGMDTKQVIARFEAERQALALMNHPNIAKVLDAGTTRKDESQETRDESRNSLDPRLSTLPQEDPTSLRSALLNTAQNLNPDSLTQSGTTIGSRSTAESGCSESGAEPDIPESEINNIETGRLSRDQPKCKNEFTNSCVSSRKSTR